jgi:hypothetical protein
MKKLLGKVKTITVPFMGDETVEVAQLTVAQVRDFQKDLEAAKADEGEDSGLKIQRAILRMAVVGAKDLTDEELDSFPLVELTKLTQKILELAGVSSGAEGNASATKS